MRGLGHMPQVPYLEILRSHPLTHLPQDDFLFLLLGDSEAAPAGGFLQVVGTRGFLDIPRYHLLPHQADRKQISASFLSINKRMIKSARERNCSRCGHSPAAHLDGIRCALCGCRPEVPQAEQAALPFRSPMAVGRYVTRRPRKK
jgi:hypothetical protein